MEIEDYGSLVEMHVKNLKGKPIRFLLDYYLFKELGPIQKEVLYRLYRHKDE